MSVVEMDEKPSVVKSEVSIKTATIASPTHGDTRNNSKHHPKKCLSWTSFIKTIWSVLFCIVVSCSLAGFFETSKLCYVKSSVNNTIVVNPPMFVTYLSTSWILLFYPIQCLTYLVRSEKKGSFLHRVKQSWYLVFPDQKQKCRYAMRFILIMILWNTTVMCFVRAANFVPVLDMIVLFCTNTSIRYLLFWVMIHKKFVALRIIAFLLSASGMIVNVYIQINTMWYKVVTALGAVTYAVFFVYIRSFLIPKNPEQVSMFYSIMALFNVAFTWPIFMFTSIVNKAEYIQWADVPWNYFIGNGISLFALILSTEVSHVTSPRGIRNLLFVGAIPIAYVVEAIWLKSIRTVNTLQIISLVLVILSMLLTAIPSSWLESVSQSVFRKPSPVQPRRLSMASRLHGPMGGSTASGLIMGNGGVRMSTSQGSQFISHRDSAAMEMFHKLGSIGSHIFSNHRTTGGGSGGGGRPRMGSIFN